MYIWSVCHGLYAKTANLDKLDLVINKKPGEETYSYGALSKLMDTSGMGNAYSTTDSVGKCPMRCKLLHKDCNWANDQMLESSRTG